MTERKPVNAPALLSRIHRVGATHPRRIEIAQAFERDQQRAAELASWLLHELQHDWGLVEWWTDEQLGEWLERASHLMVDPTH